MTRRGHTVLEAITGETFCCNEEETILAAARRSGKRIIFVGCRNGGCGMCKIRISQGEYRTGKMSRRHIGELEEKSGYTLACRTTPISSLKIEVCRRIDNEETGLSH